MIITTKRLLLIALGCCIFSALALAIIYYGPDEDRGNPVPTSKPQLNQRQQPADSKNDSARSQSDRVEAEAKQVPDIASVSSSATNRSINSDAVRSALKDGDIKTLEAAFDDLARCAQIGQKKARLSAIDRNSDASVHLKRIESEIRDDQQYCLQANHDLVSRRSFYLRQVMDRQFSPGLVERYYIAGPLGNWEDALSRPDDPLVLGWYQDVAGLLSRAAKLGDIGAMNTLVDIYRKGPINQRNQISALAYQIAETEIQVKNGYVLRDGPMIQSLKKEAANMSANDLKVAQEQARTILKACCKNINVGDMITLGSEK